MLMSDYFVWILILHLIKWGALQRIFIYSTPTKGREKINQKVKIVKGLIKLNSRLADHG